MNALQVAPALAAGCTVVLKPAELTPLTALALAELAERAGLPDGCLNVVIGDAPAIGAPAAAREGGASGRSTLAGQAREQGQRPQQPRRLLGAGAAGHELTSNQAVRKIGFTGSTAVGKMLMAAAASTVKVCAYRRAPGRVGCVGRAWHLRRLLRGQGGDASGSHLVPRDVRPRAAVRSACRWSWAATRRSSCLKTPTWSRRRRAAWPARCATPGRRASAPTGSLCTKRCTTSSPVSGAGGASLPGARDCLRLERLQTVSRCWIVLGQSSFGSLLPCASAGVARLLEMLACASVAPPARCRSARVRARPCARCGAELVSSRVRKLKVGDGLEPGTTLGPLISAAGLEKVVGHVADAMAKGGKVRRAGGGGAG